MSDLISRKALLKQFIVSDSGRRIPEYDCDNFPITISIKDVKDIIRKAPTAFDKEKVIGEIQNQHELSDTCAYESDYPTEVSYYKGRSLGHEIDIEIVEKGGIE